MSLGLRTFTPRLPVALTPRQIDGFGIHTHPAQNQSDRFKQWLGHARANDGEKLTLEVKAFLNSRDSVKTLGDLGEAWAKVIEQFFWQGVEISKADALEIVNQHWTDALTDASGRIAGKAWGDTADTMLGLAYLKRLSLSELDYQAVLRVMTFVGRAVAMREVP